MVEFATLIHLQLMIFILMGIGYSVRKWDMVTVEGQHALTTLLINVILPCNIVNSFLSGTDMSVLKAGVVILVISLANQIISILVGGKIFPGASKRELAVLKYGTICSNAGFMGNALMEGMYGAQGLLLGSIYLIPQRIAMFSFGITCFTGSRGKNVLKKILLHPCILAVIVGTVFMLLQISLPEFASKTIKALGSCTTAISMLVIGGILAEVEIRSVFSKMNFYYCFIRLIAVPAVMLAACMAFRVEPLVAGASVVLSGMPAGSTTAILAAQYGADEELAVKMVFLSTLLSMITIPLWGMAVNMLL